MRIGRGGEHGRAARALTVEGVEIDRERGRKTRAVGDIDRAGVNRVGLEQNGAMKFWGGSFVSNPFGKLLYKASHEEEETAVIDIDTAQTDRYRTHWPFMRDRRIDSYSEITKRFIDEE